MTIRIPIGTTAAGRPSYISARFANRHGLIAGATGTGKTVSLATLAQGFSDAGTSVFLVDAKGDLADAATAEGGRVIEPGAEFRIRLDDLGPDLIARALGLSDAQAGMVDIAHAAAEREGLPLATLGDLRGVLQRMEMQPRAFSDFGLVSPASVAAVRRALLNLRARDLFAAPSFDVATLLGERNGRGLVTALDATRLVESPAAYGAALLFILSELYARLPEVGDLVQPRLVLIFDESHLIFADCERPLINRFERIIRLIRSKGVGVYFATQSPADIPAPIAAQLGNRIQHALRGVTVADRRDIRAAAESLPSNPNVNAEAAISCLGVGRALVSTIGETGEPQPVEIVRVVAPRVSPGARARERAAVYSAPRARPSRPFPFVTVACVALAMAASAAVFAYASSPQVRTVAAAAAVLMALRSLIPGIRHGRH